MYRFVLLLLLALSFQGHAQVAYDLYVAADGSAQYTSIQAAINDSKAFPDQQITIHIANGVYNEKVRVYSWNPLLTLEGENPDSTIISCDDHFKKIDLGRNSTFHTYTLKVEANDFTARRLTIRNAAGPVGQAVALHSEGDRVYFENCRIEGHQDTFYGAGEGRRQYFRNCFISGSTDFIFGEATVVFDQCEIQSLSNSYITAASTPKEEPFGFVFLNCQLTAADGVDQVYLGRPWRPYAKTAFIHCELGAHIRAEGWHNWSDASRENTTYYAEYGNTGQGAALEKRVGWMKKLSKKEAKQYHLGKIFGEWKN